MDDDQLQQEWSECVKESDNGLFCEQWSSVSATVSDDYTFDDGDLELRGKLLFCARRRLRRTAWANLML